MPNPFITYKNNSKKKKSFSKAEQLKHNKKPKAKKVSKSKPTPLEQKYLTWLQSQYHYRCFVCGGYWSDWHHIKFKSTDKKIHTKLLPLCKKHHTGNELSPHGTPKKWRETYTMEEQNRLADKIYEVFLDETN